MRLPWPGGWPAPCVDRGGGHCWFGEAWAEPGGGSWACPGAQQSADTGLMFIAASWRRVGARKGSLPSAGSHHERSLRGTGSAREAEQTEIAWTWDAEAVRLGAERT